jgi:DNA polymerase III alpha subunit
VALYRPGPMENIPTYNARKHGEEEIASIHPKIDHLVKETQGVIVYQEQVMQIAQELAGYTLGQADLLRRAMGKKIRAEMEKQRGIFVEGATERGVSKPQADIIFDLLAKFADYGFNKSHAAAYAIVSYQTAYLKAHYPVEFLAASMTYDMANADKLNDFRRDARGSASRWCRRRCRRPTGASRLATTRSSTRSPPSRASARPPSITLSRSGRQAVPPRWRISPAASTPASSTAGRSKA